MAPRTDRQTKAASIRAARATRTFRSYRKGGELHHSAWRIMLFTQVELCDTCGKQGCSEKAVKRIAVNVHGTLYEVDACEEHAKQNGSWLDSF